jgi:NTE family protein
MDIENHSEIINCAKDGRKKETLVSTGAVVKEIGKTEEKEERGEIEEITEITIDDDYLNIISELKNHIFINPDFDIPVYVQKCKAKNKKILVLSGGGLKGIAHIGGIKALEDLDLLKNIDTFAGTSVGSLLLFLFVIGYTASELYEFTGNFDLGKLRNLEFMQLIEKFGMDDGKRFTYFLKKMLSAKKIDPDITFLELYNLTKKTLIMTGVCVNDLKISYMSYITYPSMPVITAVTISSCFPLVSAPISYDNKLWVDGGCIDNYPIRLFDDRLDDVIGIYLDTIRDQNPVISNLEEYLKQVLLCLFTSVSILNINGYEKYTAHVKSQDKSVTNYTLNMEEKNELYKIGYDTVHSKFC